MALNIKKERNSYCRIAPDRNIRSASLLNIAIDTDR